MRFTQRSASFEAAAKSGPSVESLKAAESLAKDRADWLKEKNGLSDTLRALQAKEAE